MINKILGIAINEYNDPKLNKINNCLNDLNAIVSILTSKYSFDDTELLSNKEHTTKKYLFERLYDYFINSLPDESVLLIYLGHGEYNETIKSSYWLPSDSDSTDASTWFNISELLSFLKASKAFHINLISDSCFSGAIFEVSRGGGVASLEGKRSRLALTSGSLEKVSDGIKGGLSPFTEYLCSILTENTESELPFSTLSNKLVLEFEKKRKQTPMFASLSNAGHEGGSMIFRLKDEGVEEKNEFQYHGFKYIEIPRDLKIDLPLPYEFDLKVPFFLENEAFDTIFVNTIVQSLGYKIVQDARDHIQGLDEHTIELHKEHGFFLGAEYQIKSLNSNFFSLTFSEFSYSGAAYPKNYIYSLNIAFNPEKEIKIHDLIEFDDFHDFLRSSIEMYSEDVQQRDALLRYIDNISSSELNFSIDETHLTLYFINHVIRYEISYGIISIPRKDLKFKIKT